MMTTTIKDSNNEEEDDKREDDIAATSHNDIPFRGLSEPKITLMAHLFTIFDNEKGSFWSFFWGGWSRNFPLD